jgi:hypothetical protein
MAAAVVVLRLDRARKRGNRREVRPVHALVAGDQRLVHAPNLLHRGARAVEVEPDRQAEQDRRHGERAEPEQAHALVGERGRVREGPEGDVVRHRPLEALRPDLPQRHAFLDPHGMQSRRPTLIALKTTPATNAAAKPSGTEASPCSARKTYEAAAAESAKSARSKTERYALPRLTT